MSKPLYLAHELAVVGEGLVVLQVRGAVGVLVVADDGKPGAGGERPLECVHVRVAAAVVGEADVVCDRERARSR